MKRLAIVPMLLILAANYLGAVFKRLRHKLPVYSSINGPQFEICLKAVVDARVLCVVGSPVTFGGSECSSRTFGASAVCCLRSLSEFIGEAKQLHRAMSWVSCA